MKLLITGGLGFIGSNFISKIFENHENWSVVNVDAELHGSNHQSLKKFEDNPGYSFVRGNITDLKLTEKLVSESDVVINFAAESHVDRSISDARPFIDSNILGVFTLLEVIKKTKKKLIHISTDEVYGSLHSGSAKEETRLNPSSPYAASKASAELLIQSYITTFGCDAIITRCTNNYGPKQFPEKLIPKTIILALNDKKIPIYGSGKNVRDWIFVGDHCDAILNVLSKGKSGESYNISAGNEIDNITIIEKILTIIGKPLENVVFVEDRPGHDFRYSMDSTKIQNTLGWSQKINFEDGLTKTIDWYLKNKEWWKNLDQKILDSTPWK
ncbi:MAG: dTDP-glucose 4,6-dehydratase [Nitrosarchaeum sp.]